MVHLKELSTCNRYKFCTCIRKQLLLLTNVLSFQFFFNLQINSNIYNRRNYDNFTYRDASFYRISWRFHSFWNNKCNILFYKKWTQKIQDTARVITSKWHKEINWHQNSLIQISIIQSFSSVDEKTSIQWNLSKLDTIGTFVRNRHVFISHRLNYQRYKELGLNWMFEVEWFPV